MSQRKDGRKGGQPQPILRQSDMLVPLLPFSTKKRTVQEHKVRNHHRKYFHEDLEEVEAAWVEAEDGLLECRIHDQIEIEISSEGVPNEDIPKPADETDAVNVRLLIVCGICPPTGTIRDQKHVLRRLDIIAASIPAESRLLTTYGGLTSQGPDSQLISSLINIVKIQSGLDLSPVTKWTKLGRLKYTDKPDTVIFMPHLWGIPDLEIHPQVKMEAEEYEEEVEEEVEMTEDEERREKEGEDDDMGEGEEAEPKVNVVKKVVTKTRENIVKTMQPTKIAMGTLHEYNLAINTSNETVELCTAVDLFDEWLKREFATKIADFLSTKQTEAKKKLEEAQRLKEEEESRKRKRCEQEEECRKKKMAKISKLQEAWEAEDVGKTDEDKKESEKERKAVLEELDREEKAELAKLLPETSRKGQEVKTLGHRIQPLFDSFQFFDRPRGLTTSTGTLSRGWLAQQLLCLDKQRTYGDCLELVTLDGLHPKGQPLDYEKMSTEEKTMDGDEAMEE